MFYGAFAYFTVLLSVASATLKGAEKLFPEYTEYIYKLETNITTGTEVPVESFSYWTLNAKLHVYPYNVSRIRYQLVDIKSITYNGATAIHRTDVPAAALILREAWDATYQESGALAAVYVSDNEPFWSGNIKRAIALNLQLVQPENANSMPYTIQEPCLHGICIAEYTSLDGNTITKMNDIPTAQPGYGRFFWYSVPTDTCYDEEMKYPFVGSVVRSYRLNGGKGLVGLESRSTLQYYTSANVFAVNTEFKLTLDSKTHLKPSENLLLRYTYPMYHPHYYKQPYAGRVVTEQNKLAQLTNEYLRNVTRSIEENRVVPNRDLVHNMDILELQKIMSQLEYDTLMTLYRELAVGTSYDDETKRNIFYEMLPHLKSSAGALFVKYLVVEHKQSVEDLALLSLIRNMPFNVANYSEDLLTRMEAFTILGPDFKKDIRYACILSYATLAYYTYINGGCSEDHFGKIVTKYFKMYSEYPSYEDRLIWLQGLSNLQVGLVHKYLAPKIMNSSTDVHERFLGLWATIPNVAADSSLISVLSLPILNNENEPVKLRIAALLQILSTADLSPGRIMEIHNYIMRSKNDQLKKFWHTTAKSLKESDYNCCPSARYISRIVKKKFNADPAHWATGNYIYGVTDKSHKGSAYVQLMGIGDPSTDLPEFGYFYLRTTRDGSVVDNSAVMLIVEGLPSHVYKELISATTSNVTVDRLFNVLKKLKVQTRNPEKVHVDVVVKIHDKTVNAAHFNYTTLSLLEGREFQRFVQDFLQSGSHINQQMVLFPMQVELNLATEFGTPVTLHNTMSSLSSLRGGLSGTWTDDTFTFDTDLTFRYRGTAVTSLSTIGPVMFSEHTTRSQQSVVIQLPMKIKIEAQLGKKTFQYNIYQPPTGVAIHSRTQALVTWENQNGIKSDTIYTVGDRKQYENETQAFTNCEDFNEISEILSSFKTNAADKIGFLSSFLLTNFIMRRGMVLMTVHPSGSCGYYEDYRSYRPLEIKFTLRDHTTKAGSLKLKIEHEMKALDLPNVPGREHNIEYSLSVSGDNITETASFGSSMWNYMVCLNETDFNTSVSADTSSAPSDHTGQFRIHFGPYRQSCPNNLDIANTLQFDFKIENSGLYSDEGVTRHLTLRTVGKLDEPWSSYMSELLTTVEMRRGYFNFTTRMKEHNGIVAYSIDGGRNMYSKSNTVGNVLQKLNMLQLLRNIGVYKKCTLQENSVQTFNGKYEAFKSYNCEENLVAAECTKNPGFAISRNKNGTYNFYTRRDKISITPPRSGIIVVQVNGISVTYDNGYTNPEKSFRISRSGHAVLIQTIESGIRLYYTLRETSILMPSPYMNTVCGECTSQYMYNDC